MARVWIAEIRISAAMVEKLASKHGVDTGKHETAEWIRDHRGPRLLVTGWAAGRLLVVVLYPVDLDFGIFNLGTARWRKP